MKAVDMISSKMTLAATLAGAMTLGACTDTGKFGANPNDPNMRTKNGALIGAGVGALAGALSKGDGNRGEAAIKGALVGSAIGAGVGYAVPGGVIAVGPMVPMAALDNIIDGIMESRFGIDPGLLITGSIWPMVLALSTIHL